MDKETKMTPKQREQAERKFRQLQRAAYKAVLARDAFETLLEKTKERTGEWERMCEAMGMSPDGDAGDWMC